MRAARARVIAIYMLSLSLTIPDVVELLRARGRLRR
jgi:hypothetical protein